MAKFPLVELRKRLEDGFDGKVPSPSKLYQMVAGGYLPGSVEYGRRLVDDAALPEIAQILGLTPRAKARRSNVAA